MSARGKTNCLITRFAQRPACIYIYIHTHTEYQTISVNIFNTQQICAVQGKITSWLLTRRAVCREGMDSRWQPKTVRSRSLLRQRYWASYTLWKGGFQNAAFIRPKDGSMDRKVLLQLVSPVLQVWNEESKKWVMAAQRLVGLLRLKDVDLQKKKKIQVSFRQPITDCCQVRDTFSVLATQSLVTSFIYFIICMNDNSSVCSLEKGV